jgi:hypothetical protein
VYADVDVQALQPIDTWNDEHGHDAAVLLGVENYDAERTSSPLHVVNWALAATPGHPLLARLPGVVARAAARQFLELAASQSKLLSADVYESGIIDRTGPAALSRAMYEHFEEASGIHPGDLSYDANVTSPAGLLVDGVRVLPMPAMAGVIQRQATSRPAMTSRGLTQRRSCVTCTMGRGGVPGAFQQHALTQTAELSDVTGCALHAESVRVDAYSRWKDTFIGW